MKFLSRKILVLLILDFALLVLIGVGLLFSPASASRRSGSFELLKNTESIASISISGKGAVDLIRDGAAWSLRGEDGTLPADSGRVKLFLEALAAIDKREPVASKKEAWNKLGLEGDESSTVRLGNNDGVTMVEFILGSYAQAPGTVYFATPESPAAFTVASSMASYVSGGRNSWLDLRVWSTMPAVEQVQEIVLQSELADEGGKISAYRATRSKGAWESDGIVLDSNKVEAMLRALINFRGSDYAPAAETIGTQKASVELVLGNGTSLRLTIGQERPDGKYPALSSQRNRILYLPAWTVEEAIKDVTSLR